MTATDRPATCLVTALVLLIQFCSYSDTFAHTQNSECHLPPGNHDQPKAIVISWTDRAVSCTTWQPRLAAVYEPCSCCSQQPEKLVSAKTKATALARQQTQAAVARQQAQVSGGGLWCQAVSGNQFSIM